MIPNRNTNQCIGKKKYSKHRAERVKLDCMKWRNRKIRVYQCQLCHHYHLTSEKRY